MAMPVDESRDDDRCRGVDQLGVGCGVEAWPDVLDPLALDQDVGVGDVAEVRIEGDGEATADQNA